MSCECESLTELREETRKINELERSIHNYIEIFEHSKESDSVLDNGFIEKIREVEDVTENYVQNFLNACRTNKINVQIGNFKIEYRLAYLIAFVDGATKTDFGISYHCSECDYLIK